MHVRGRHPVQTGPGTGQGGLTVLNPTNGSTVYYRYTINVADASTYPSSSLKDGTLTPGQSVTINQPAWFLCDPGNQTDLVTYGLTHLTSIVQMTAADYAAMLNPDPQTLYVIVG